MCKLISLTNKLGGVASILLIGVLSMPAWGQAPEATIRVETNSLLKEFQNMVRVLEDKRKDTSWETFQNLYRERLDIFKKHTERALQKNIPPVDADLIYYGAYLNLLEIFPRIGMPGLANTYEEMFGLFFKELWTGQTVQSVSDALLVLKARVYSHELGAHGEGSLSEIGKSAIRLYETLADARIQHLHRSDVVP